MKKLPSRKQNTVFHALARPPMMMGVSYSFFIVNCMVHLCALSLTHSLKTYLSLLAFHALGSFLCKFDAHIFNILFAFLKRRLLRNGAGVLSIQRFEG